MVLQQNEAESSTFLPGGQPGNGGIARAFIRTRDDISIIEKYSFDELLPANTILECIESAAALHSDKPAIKHLLSADPAFGPRVISYRELVDQIRAAASLFEADSAGTRPAVGVMLPMLPEAHIAGWGASAVGVCCQINPFLEIGIIASILNAAGATVLVTTDKTFGPGAWNQIDVLKANVPSLRKVYFVGVADAENDFNVAIAAQAAKGAHFTRVTDPEAEATFLPTGGTTATPKLVRMTQKGQLVNAWINGAIGGSRPDGVVGHAMPNFHVGGYVVLGLRALIFGQTLLTLTVDGFRNPQVVSSFWDIARAHSMTAVLATPATAAAILATAHTSAEGHPIEVFHCGASTIPVALAKAFHEKFGVWLRELWGMTEVHGVVTGHPNGILPVVGSVGVQMPHQPVKAIIVDENNSFVRECAPGERGALVITGPGVTKGYVNPALNAGFHVRNTPDGKLWGNTGDLGMIDKDGYVWIFGRAKDVIIRGGHNIDANMIEEVLVRHPAVLVAAAIGRPDSEKGELPIAYVQLKPGTDASVDELMALCRKDVQERAAVPVELYILDTMPLTAVGKINKPVLRREITGEVARGVAAGTLAGSHLFEVVVDESGARPRVTLTIAGKQDAGIEEKLRSAFRTYEFNTDIVFSG